MRLRVRSGTAQRTCRAHSAFLWVNYLHLGVSLERVYFHDHWRRRVISAGTQTTWAGGKDGGMRIIIFFLSLFFLQRPQVRTITCHSGRPLFLEVSRANTVITAWFYFCNCVRGSLAECASASAKRCNLEELRQIDRMFPEGSASSLIGAGVLPLMDGF